MSKEKRRVPKLRFPGFTEDWEQRKLGAMCSLFIDGDWIESKDQSNEGIRLIQTGNIGVGKFIDKPENKKWISHSTFNNLRCKELLDGDILISRLPQPAGRACIVNTNNEKWITAVDCTIVRLLDQYSNKFILQSLCTYNYFHLIDSFLAGGTRQRVSRSNLSDINIMSPKKIEQDKIGLFFEYVDNLITLHQRKLEHLNLKKKALLQKLFPKDGERYPELRFPGFTDAWEQRKLSELATMNARIGWQNLRTSEFLDSGDYLLITGTDFDNGRIKYGTCHYVEKKRFDQDTKIQLSTGSILITKDGTLGKVALVEELPKPATLNAGVFNVRVKDDAVLSYKYLYHYLKAPFLMKYVTANATGGTIKHLNQSILVDFPIPITEKLEQDRIAKLLDSLELSITLHQRKLEDLQLQKKALLQQMFV